MTNKRPIENMLPHNLEAEKGFLSSLIADPDLLFRCDFMQPEMFYTLEFQWIFQGLKEIYEGGATPDPILLSNWLQEKGYASEMKEAFQTINTMFSNAYTALNATKYAQQIRELFRRRQYIYMGGEIAKLGYNDTLEASDRESQIYNLMLSQALEAESKAKSAAEAMAALAAHLQGMKDGTIPRYGINFGLKNMQAIWDGAKPGHFAVVGARPGMGKSTLVLQLLREQGKAGVTGAIFSLEMSEIELSQHLVASDSGVDADKLTKAEMSDVEWLMIGQAMEELSKYPIYLEEVGTLTVAGLRTKALKLAIIKNIKFLVVDYLQLMSGDNNRDNREQEVSKISRGLKNLARELGIAIIAVAQLSRAVENRDNKRPIMADLRYNGQLEQDADVIWFLYREGYYNPKCVEPNVTEAIKAKDRHGKYPKMAKLLFDGSHNRFVDCTTIHLNEPTGFEEEEYDF